VERDAQGYRRFYAPDGSYVVRYPATPSNPRRRFADVVTAVRSYGLGWPRPAKTNTRYAQEGVVVTSTWTVRVVVTTRGPVSDAALDRLADLADSYDATVARYRNGTSVVMTFDADQDAAVDAAITARTLALNLVNAVGAADAVVDLRVCTPDLYEAEALRPDTPELLSASEVGGVLGVSR
jgi:hypothetical protein